VECIENLVRIEFSDVGIHQAVILPAGVSLVGYLERLSGGIAEFGNADADLVYLRGNVVEAGPDQTTVETSIDQLHEAIGISKGDRNDPWLSREQRDSILLDPGSEFNQAHGRCFSRAGTMEGEHIVIPHDDIEAVHQI